MTTIARNPETRETTYDLGDGLTAKVTGSGEWPTHCEHVYSQMARANIARCLRCGHVIYRDLDIRK